MNATNRGIVAGLDLTLKSIEEILMALSEKEAEKEYGMNGGAPIGEIRGYCGIPLEEAAIYIHSARCKLAGILPNKIDFAEYIGGTETPDVDCEILYNREE